MIKLRDWEEADRAYRPAASHGHILGTSTAKNGEQHAVLWTLRSG